MKVTAVYLPFKFFCGTSNLLFYPCPRLSFLKYEKKKSILKKILMIKFETII